jgi:putative peptidoglycan lipid II flippase
VSSGGVAAATGGGKGAGRLVYDSAYLIFVLPHSLVAVSLVTAIFTRMSRAAAEGRRDAVRADLSLGLRTVGIATVLATAGFVVLARDLAYVMFGAAGREQSDVIGWAATTMALGLVAYSAQYLAQRVFYAYEDARTPFGVQLVQTLVWVAGILVVRWQLDGVQVVVGAGAALAVSLLVGATMSLVQVRVHLGGVGVAQIVRTHVRLFVGAVLAAIAGWSVKVFVVAWLGESRGAAAVGLVAAGVVMVGVYGAVLKVLQVRELDDLVEPFVGRLRRR